MSVVGRFMASLPRALLGALVLLALSPVGRAADDDDSSPVGRPEFFNGAKGKFERPTATADPLQVQAEDPITYTLRITATEVVRPPKRPALSEFPDFTDDFYIEDAAPLEGRHPDENTWEFVYHLKPKTTKVNTIPGFPFVFDLPGDDYQKIYSPEIAITVVPRKQVAPSSTGSTPISGPDMAFSLADGDALRRTETRLPGPFVFLLALLAPPIGCIAWYLIWRRLYPNEARRALRRRSRAAQEALRALRNSGKQTDPEKQARGAAAVVARYLQQRLDWQVVEPTPAEVESYLRTQDVSEKLAARTADLLRSCAAVCYDPERPSHAELSAAVSEAILALEAETWSD
jgi:hypothetical protein